MDANTKRLLILDGVAALDASAPAVPGSRRPAQAGLVPAYRVSVLVPTASNPPVRAPFGPEVFARFEMLLRTEATGFTRRRASGEWFDGETWVTDESVEYVVTVRTREEAEPLAGALERFVSREFAQDLVLVSISTELSTLFSTQGGSDEAA
jgi:hypothetical protein